MITSKYLDTRHGDPGVFWERRGGEGAPSRKGLCRGGLLVNLC